MPATFVKRVASTVIAASNLNQVVPLAAATSIPVGHTLIVAMRTSGGAGVSSISDSKGNTYTVDQSSASATTRAHIGSVPVSVPLIGLGDTITVHLSLAAQLSCAVYEYSGLLIPTAADQGATGGNATAATSGSAGPTGTTTQADELAATVAAFAVAQGSFTVPAGFTERASGLTQVDLADEALSAVGTVTAGWTGFTSSAWGVVVQTYKAAAVTNSSSTLGERRRRVGHRRALTVYQTL
jgi:hypothetical protein